MLALLLQMVGAFGHTHLGHGGGVGLAFAKQTVADTAVADDATIHKAKPPLGADHDAVCAICLAGALVAAAVTASPPVLVLPVAYLLLGPPQSAVVVAGLLKPAAFWSRGPPLS